MNISKYFTLHEALYLPSWSREANASDGLNDNVMANLKEVFSRIDSLREFFNSPIIVHVAYRPEAYNKLIGGAEHSAHLLGKAVDFHVQGLDCESARQNILNNGLLDKLNLRMEDNGEKATWLHVDTAPVVHSRFFKP